MTNRKVWARGSVLGVILTALILGNASAVPFDSCPTGCTCTFSLSDNLEGCGGEPICYDNTTWTVVSSTNGCCDTGTCNPPGTRDCSYQLTITVNATTGQNCCMFINNQDGSECTTQYSKTYSNSALPCGDDDSYTVRASSPDCTVPPPGGCVNPCVVNRREARCVKGPNC